MEEIDAGPLVGSTSKPENRKRRGLDQKSGFSKPVVSGKKVRNAFSNQHPTGKDVWVCKCLTSRKQTGGGYTNLVSHIRSAHPDELQEFLKDSKSATASHSLTRSSFYVRKATKNLYG